MANSVTRWDPWQELANFRQSMDQLLDSGLGRLGVMRDDEIRTRGLALDVVEGEDHYTVRAAIPGVKPDDVEIAVEDSVLTIRGEHKEEQTSDGENYLRREIRWGSFERSLRLPPTVDADRAEARFENGMLTLELPKRPEAQPKRIKITALENERS